MGKSGEVGEQGETDSWWGGLVSRRQSSQVRGSILGVGQEGRITGQPQRLPRKPPAGTCTRVPFSSLALGTVLPLPVSVPQLSPGTVGAIASKGGCLYRIGGCPLPAPPLGFSSLSPCSVSPFGPPALPPPSSHMAVLTCKGSCGREAPPHTLTVDGELDGSLRVGVQAAVVSQAGVQASVGAAGTDNGVGGPSMDLGVLMQPHVATGRVGCSQAAQSHFLPLTGPEALVSEARWLHGDHRVVWTIWRAREARHASLAGPRSCTRSCNDR